MSYPEKQLAKAGFPAPGLGDTGAGEGEALDLKEYIAIFYRRRWLMLGVFAIIFLLGMAYTFVKRPIYESTSRLLISSNKGPGGADEKLSIISDLQALTQGRSVDTTVEIISSDDLLDAAYNHLDALRRLRDFGDLRLPTWVVDIAAKKNTDVIDIKVRSYSPESSAMLAEQIAQTYFQRDLEQNNQATRQVVDYVRDNLGKVQHDETQADLALAQYKKETGLIAPDTQLAKAAEGMASLNLELSDARADQAAGLKSLRTLEQELRDQKAEIIAQSTVTENPRYASILSRVDELNSTRAQLLQEYTPQSDEVQAVDGRISDEKARLAQVAQTIVAAEMHASNPVRDDVMKNYSEAMADQSAAGAKIAALDSEYQQRKQQATIMPDRERQLLALMEKADLLKQTYAMLTEKFHELQLSEHGMLPNGRLISHARIPLHVASPKLANNAILFFLLAAIAAISVAMISERLDDRLHDQDTVEAMAQTATLAMVPRVKADQPTLITEVGRHSPLLESFRILRNNISFASIDKPMKVMAVSSAGPGEGKSTICANLALAMAMDGKKVVVVDCDLRRPSMHTVLNMSREVGFTNVMTGTSTLEDAVVPTSISGLDFLATGPLPPNSTEVLNTQQSRKVFSRLSEQYDMVLVDCPPCTGLSDVQVISTLVDGLLLVVSLNQTVKHGLQATVRTLAQADTNLIGVVLNRLDMQRNSYYYYYYEDADGSKKRKKKQRHEPPTV